jgi:hypothetical protein
MWEAFMTGSLSLQLIVSQCQLSKSLMTMPGFEFMWLKLLNMLDLTGTVTVGRHKGCAMGQS